MAIDHLTALDGTFIELEDADASAHMHIGAIMVFGPRPSGGAPELGEVRAYLDARLHALPRFRERLAGPNAGGLEWQRWIRDEHFDISRHVTSAMLPRPGGWEQLLEWAGEYFSRRLDRSMPLWEVVLVHGLGAGRWALVSKTHHCLVDGVGAVDAAYLLLDGVAEAVAGATAPSPKRHDLLPTWLPIGAVEKALAAGVRTATHPREAARRAAALGDLLVSEEIKGAPDVSINRPIGPARILRGVSVDVDEVRRVKTALGGTVNDVVLAGVCAGLRQLLLARGEPRPARGLRAMVPMNVRGEAEHASELGNRISSLFVDLPVAEPDALARFERIRQTTAAVKHSRQPLGADTLLQLTSAAPPVLHHLLARSLFAKRLFNLTVTNVPGPPIELSALGGPLETVWPLVPLAADHGLGIAVISYNGRLTFGINADKETLPDVDVLAAGITDGLAELQALAHPAS